MTSKNLNFDVPGVPQPAQIKWASLEELEELGLPHINGVYATTHAAYTEMVS